MALSHVRVRVNQSARFPLNEEAQVSGGFDVWGRGPQPGGSPGFDDSVFQRLLG